MNKKTYSIALRSGQKSIKCLVCNAVSYHPRDIEHKYCANCHEFHAWMMECQQDMDFKKRSETSRRKPRGKHIGHWKRSK